MSWLAQSPDLNPTENVRMMVKRHIDTKILKYDKNFMTLIEKEWIVVPI